MTAKVKPQGVCQPVNKRWQEPESRQSAVKRAPCPKSLAPRDAVETIPPLDARAWLRVETAAGVLGLSRATAYKLVASGELGSVRIGRSVRVPRHRLEEYQDGLESTREQTGGKEVPAAGPTSSGRETG